MPSPCKSKRKRKREMATVRVSLSVPSAVEDAELLRKACQGWGTEEKMVIDILAHRDAAQRLQIMQSYEELYHENLISRLETELSGDFEKAMYRWVIDPVEREAIIANEALKGELDYRVIIEAAYINTTDELLAVKKAYQHRFKRSLEEDVASKTSGDLQKLLVGLVSTYRYDGEDVDSSLASTEANILHDAIKKGEFSHDEVIRIFATRSKCQLNATFNRYKDENGVSISKDLSSGTADPFPLVLRIIIRCVVSPHKYFEKLLRSMLNKAEINEDTLTRIIVTRAEKDLKIVKDMYEERVNAKLADSIGKQTSGHYKDFLLALVGN